MTDFPSNLLEEAKRFLEKSKDASDDEARSAFLHASLFLASSALEGFVNSIASDFLTRQDLTVHERGFLAEREVRLREGSFVVSDSLKMVRMEDRIGFLCAKYGRERIPKSQSWWSELQQGGELRNQLTHPRAAITISADQVGRYISAVVELLEFLFRKIYKKGFPAKARGIHSKCSF